MKYRSVTLKITSCTTLVRKQDQHVSPVDIWGIKQYLETWNLKAKVIAKEKL